MGIMVTDCRQCMLGACRAQVPPGLHCSGCEVVNLSMILGSSQVRKMEEHFQVNSQALGVQLPARLESAFFHQSKAITVNRA